ncbi:MAG: hypothetical protein ACOYYS_11365 [Chloroflexota bacterium]
MNTEIEFVGFAEPSENYYRLPNNWFEIAALLRASFGERFASPLKMMEYILRHTWGYRRFDGQVRLSARDIYSGRNVNGHQIDLGTGLSENSVTRAARALEKLGLIEMEYNDSDPARRIRSFRPRIHEEEKHEETDGTFNGFDLPTENYFKVPVSWTNLTRETGSAACILSTEYFIRHGWGYNNPNGTWMDSDDVANGRKYVNTKRRYDKGTGFEISTIQRALNEAVERGFLVWAERWDENTYTFRRVYNLRLKGMPIAPDGKYLGRLPWEEEIVEALSSSGSCTDEAGNSIDEVGRCIDEVGKGTLEAQTTSIVEDRGRIVEEAKSVDEEGKSIVEEIGSIDEARTEATHTFKDTLNQHFNQTLSTTPTSAGAENALVLDANLVAADAVDVAVAEFDGAAENGTELPEEIRQALARLQWTDTGDEVTRAFQANAALVRQWLHFALTASDIRNRAGMFRKGLRSGKQPPYTPQVSSLLEPDDILHPEDGQDDIDDTQPEDTNKPWPEVDANTRRAWDLLTSQLQMEMPRSTYETYLHDTRPVAYTSDDGRFVIGARTDYNRMWLEGRLASTCKRLLSGALNRSVDVSFVVW